MRNLLLLLITRLNDIFIQPLKKYFLSLKSVLYNKNTSILESPSTTPTIILYAGSFDPFHCGHYAIIQQILAYFSMNIDSQIELDSKNYTNSKINADSTNDFTLLLLPAFQNPLKNLPFFSPEMRLEMCQIIADDINENLLPHTKIIISDYEIRQSRAVYSIESIKHIKALYGANARILFVLGRDSFDNLAKWHKSDEICALVEFILIARPAHNDTQEILAQPLARNLSQPQTPPNTTASQPKVQTHTAPNDKTPDTPNNATPNTSHATQNPQAHSIMPFAKVPNARIAAYLTLPHNSSQYASSYIQSLFAKNAFDEALKLIPQCLHSYMRDYFKL